MSLIGYFSRYGSVDRAHFSCVNHGHLHSDQIGPSRTFLGSPDEGKVPSVT